MVYFVVGKKEDEYEYDDPSFGKKMTIGGNRNVYTRSSGVDCWGISAGSQHKGAYANAGISHQAANRIAGQRLRDRDDDSHLLISFSDSNIARVLPCMYQAASKTASDFLEAESGDLDAIKKYCQNGNIHLLVRCEVLFQSCDNPAYSDKLLDTKKMLAKETANIIKRVPSAHCQLYGGRYYPADYSQEKIKYAVEDEFDNLVMKTLSKSRPNSSPALHPANMFKSMVECWKGIRY